MFKKMIFVSALLVMMVSNLSYASDVDSTSQTDSQQNQICNAENNNCLLGVSVMAVGAPFCGLPLCITTSHAGAGALFAGGGNLVLWGFLIALEKPNRVVSHQQSASQAPDYIIPEPLAPQPIVMGNPFEMIPRPICPAPVSQSNLTINPLLELPLLSQPASSGSQSMGHGSTLRFIARGNPLEMIPLPTEML